LIDFDVVYDRHRGEIDLLSHTQRVPGLDPDDVASEMLVVLWKASQTYRPGATSFGTYWWSLWLNRRSDLAGSYYARKRVHAISTDQVPDSAYYDRVEPEAPVPTTAVGRLIWKLLAAGEPGTEIRSLTDTSRRRYYDTIQEWRTEEVRDLLRP